jgi:hypothetical protein
VSGPDSQQIGDEGEIAVEHALRKGGFLTGRLSPDPGEDLWVEIDGRRASAQGTFPYRALVQAKGVRGGTGNTFAYDLKTKHVRRWAAQPLPVFVVGVDLDTDRFFAKSIDDILSQDLGGQDPMQLTGTTVRAHLPMTKDLGASLRAAIENHYRSSQLDLSRVDQQVIEHDCFEVLQRKPPEPGSPTPIASWQILWKSPARPQHLAAMLTELARQASHEYAAAHPKPAFVVFHVFRSQFDLHRNLATVRVDWVDPSHPQAADITRILGAPGGFKFRFDQDVDELREVLCARTATAADFRQFGAQVGASLDEVADALLAGPALDGWSDALVARFEKTDSLWDAGPDAPVECASLDDALKALHQALFSSYFVAKYRRAALPHATLERLLRQSLEQIQTCRGAWRRFVRP